MWVPFLGAFLPLQPLGPLLLEECAWQIPCGLVLIKQNSPLAPVSVVMLWFGPDNGNIYHLWTGVLNYGHILDSRGEFLLSYHFPSPTPNKLSQPPGWDQNIEFFLKLTKWFSCAAKGCDSLRQTAQVSHFLGDSRGFNPLGRGTWRRGGDSQRCLGLLCVNGMSWPGTDGTATLKAFGFRPVAWLHVAMLGQSVGLLRDLSDTQLFLEIYTPF